MSVSILVSTKYSSRLQETKGKNIKKGRKKDEKEQEWRRKKKWKKEDRSEGREKGRGRNPGSIQTIEIPIPFITRSLTENNSKGILHTPYKLCCDSINFMFSWPVINKHKWKTETDIVIKSLYSSKITWVLWNFVCWSNNPGCLKNPAN